MKGMISASEKEIICIQHALSLKPEHLFNSVSVERQSFFSKIFSKIRVQSKQLNNSRSKEFKVSSRKTLLELWSLYGFYGDDLIVSDCLNFWIMTLHNVKYDSLLMIENRKVAIRENQKKLREEAERSGNPMIRVNYGNIIHGIIQSIDKELGYYNA